MISKADLSVTTLTFQFTRLLTLQFTCLESRQWIAEVGGPYFLSLPNHFLSLAPLKLQKKLHDFPPSLLKNMCTGKNCTTLQLHHK